MEGKIYRVNLKQVGNESGIEHINIKGSLEGYNIYGVKVGNSLTELFTGITLVKKRLNASDRVIEYCYIEEDNTPEDIVLRQIVEIKSIKNGLTKYLRRIDAIAESQVTAYKNSIELENAKQDPDGYIKELRKEYKDYISHKDYNKNFDEE